MDNSHTYLANLYKQTRKTNEERYSQNSKTRLLKNIEKKFQTAMIGTLARCEEKFGFLWGFNQDKKLTKDQIEFQTLWEDLRTEILNHCNSQARAAMEEMSQYSISWNKYKTDFIIKQR